MTAPAPQEDRLLHHQYDGIQEFDNPLPFWWKGIFVLTIAFAIAYGYWYHLGGPGLSEHEEYAAELKQYEARRAERALSEAITIDEAGLATMAADSAILDRGRVVFLKTCASCHTEDGRGLVGPNLTDSFQIHGSTRLDIHRTIVEGVPAKGMLAWGTILSPADVAAAASFVIGLRGTDVPGGKPAEGAAVEAFR